MGMIERPVLERARRAHLIQVYGDNVLACVTRQHCFPAKVLALPVAVSHHPSYYTVNR